jgi:hypothetical protein
MLKRIALAAGLVLAGVSATGCRLAAPAYESMGGYSQCGQCDSKTKMILRQQGRNSRHIEEFMDTYFLNYDINDPYRGDYLVLDGTGCCR